MYKGNKFAICLHITKILNTVTKVDKKTIKSIRLFK